MRAMDRHAGDYAARRHHLDVVGVLAQLLAHALAHLIDAVDDTGKRAGRTAAGVAEVQLLPGAEVALAPCLRQGQPGDEQAGAREVTLADRLGEAPVGSRTLVNPRTSIPSSTAFACTATR
jgi:hypothetical protein